MRYGASAKSDVGRKRHGNEDSFCLAPEIGLFVVADGMGGHAAGEVHFFSRARLDPHFGLSASQNPSQIHRIVIFWTHAVNRPPA